MKKRTIIILVIAVVVVGVAAFFIARNGKHELVVRTAPVETTKIENSVTATGYVQPVDKVEVGTQVSGVIEKIYVDYNTQVKRGQLLAELDKSTLSEKVSQGKASVASAESNLTYAQQNYERVKQLYDAKAATPAAYEEAVNKLTQANTEVVNAKANLHQAEVNYSYAEIYSPIDGIILDRAVEQGQTVAASFSTPTLFTIANDLKNMQVEADVDEADIGGVRNGQKVTFTVDSYPDDTFNGTVKQIRLQPTVTSNVVTYTVIIDAPNPDEKLYPGMTANVTITTQEIEGIGVLMEALNFRPANDIAKMMHLPPDVATGKKGQSVWVKTGDGYVRKDINVGTNDGVYVIVNSGLNKGEVVVLSAALEKKTDNKKDAASNPFMPKPPKRR